MCQTDFLIYERLSQLGFGIALLLGLFGIGSLFQKPEKQLSFAPNQFAGGISNTKSDVSNQKSEPRVSTNTAVQTPEPINSSSLQTKSQAASLKSSLKNNQVEIPANDPSETIYFCGAQTKKGTLCSRRVKGGGRCWQHAGQAAMLPQAKLIASK